MILRPFFSFFGAKWRAAPHYPAPQHHTIVEPFAGSAGYSVRYAWNYVHLYDIDEAICGVWDFLIHATTSELRHIPVDIDHVTELPDWVCQEARWLVGFWMNKASSAPHLSRSKWAKQYPEQFWGPKIRERVAGQVGFIRHWTITQASYRDVLPVEATWFVDPPYIGAGRFYRHGSKDIDYDHLGHWCRGLPGQVVVCENEGADWLPFEPFRTIKATSGHGRAGVSKEVVWLNPEDDVTVRESVVL